jgi:hypothetical protein
VAQWRRDIEEGLERRAGSPSLDAISEALSHDGLVTLLEAASLGCAGAGALLARLLPTGSRALRAEASEALTAALLAAAREVLDAAERSLDALALDPESLATLSLRAAELEREDDAE